MDAVCLRVSVCVCASGAGVRLGCACGGAGYLRNRSTPGEFTPHAEATFLIQQQEFFH